MFDSNWAGGQAVYLVAVVGVIAAIVVYLTRAFRIQGRKPWPSFFVGIYNILLLLLFLFGMTTQRELEGFGFLPLMALTLPWSGLLDWVLTHSDIADKNLLGGGLADTFFCILIIHNVLAASANSFILYFFLKRRRKKQAEDDAWEQARWNR
jgi:hypothetical protein